MRRLRTPLAGLMSRAAPVAAALALGLVSTAAGESARLAGDVFKIDTDKHEVTIVDAGRRYVLAYSADTVIRAAGQDRTIADLKRGDRVVVTVANDDPGRAARIAIAGQAAGPAPGAGFASGRAGVPAFAPGLNARTPPR